MQFLQLWEFMELNAKSTSLPTRGQWLMYSCEAGKLVESSADLDSSPFGAGYFSRLEINNIPHAP